MVLKTSIRENPLPFGMLLVCLFATIVVVAALLVGQNEGDRLWAESRTQFESELAELGVEVVEAGVNIGSVPIHFYVDTPEEFVEKVKALKGTVVYTKDAYTQWRRYYYLFYEEVVVIYAMRQDLFAGLKER